MRGFVLLFTSLLAFSFLMGCKEASDQIHKTTFIFRKLSYDKKMAKEMAMSYRLDARLDVFEESRTRYKKMSIYSGDIESDDISEDEIESFMTMYAPKNEEARLFGKFGILQGKSDVILSEAEMAKIIFSEERWAIKIEQN